MANGRKTGGRGRGTPNKDRKDLAKIIERAIPTEERMNLLAEVARGVTVQVTNSQGSVKIYIRPPDAKAIEQLNAYQYGKPAQRYEIAESDEDQNVNVVLIPSGMTSVRKNDESTGDTPQKKKNEQKRD